MIGWFAQTHTAHEAPSHLQVRLADDIRVRSSPSNTSAALTGVFVTTPCSECPAEMYARRLERQGGESRSYPSRRGRELVGLVMEGRATRVES